MKNTAPAAGVNTPPPGRRLGAIVFRERPDALE
jgi:hypothetical protein